MTAVPLALSLSDSFTKVGAVVAFAAFLGIALLAMLFFAQARELKRLREWSEQEPARMAELEHRLSSAMAMRIQRATAQPARSVASAQAVNAAAPATRVVQEAPPAVVFLPAAPAVIGGSIESEAGAEPSADEPQSAVTPDPAATEWVGPGSPAVHAEASEPEEVDEVLSALAGVAAEAPLVAAEAPATAAPAAAGAASPAGAASRAGAASPAVAAAPPVAPSSPRAPTPPPRPARPVARRPADARRTADPARLPGDPQRRPASPLSNGRSQSPARPVRRRGGPPPGPPFLREEPARGRGRLLIVLAAAVVVTVVVAIEVFGSGNSSRTSSGNTAPVTIGSETVTSRTHHREVSLPASNPSETHVVVFNGTETEGLAHRLSSNLQQSGYTLAAALSGNPPGSYSATVVEYASGHHADADHVAQTLGVTQVRRLDPALAAMAAGASVVVVAGPDQVGVVGGEATGTTGEASAGAGQ
jgi:hypothetical protein